MMVGILLSFWVPAYLLTMEVEKHHSTDMYRQSKKQPMSLILLGLKIDPRQKVFFCGKMVTEGPIRVPVPQRIAGPEERIYTHNVPFGVSTGPADGSREGGNVEKVDWPSVPHLLMRCCLRSSCSVWMARFFKTVDRCSSS